MRITLLIVLITVLTYSCNNNGQNPPLADNKQIEKELLTAIEDRFFSWRDNDFEEHMKTYHQDWKRWAMREDKLLTKEEFSGLWDYMKSGEESQEMEITLVDYDILGDGNVALVHYTAAETFKWIGPDNERGWKTGDVYKGMLRWSDVLVKENGKWLCIGGHRDLSRPEREPIKLN
jgi:hypothetical protein